MTDFAVGTTSYQGGLSMALPPFFLSNIDNLTDISTQNQQITATSALVQSLQRTPLQSPEARKSPIDAPDTSTIHTTSASDESSDGALPLYAVNSSTIQVKFAEPGRSTIAFRTKKILKKITRLVHTIKVFRHVKRYPKHYFPRIDLSKTRLHSFDKDKSDLMDVSLEREFIQEAPFVDSPPHFNVTLCLNNLHCFLNNYLGGRCKLESLVPLFSRAGVLSVPAIQSLMTSKSVFSKHLHFCDVRLEYSQLSGLDQIASSSICFGDLMYHIVKHVLGDSKPIHILAETITFSAEIDRDNSMYAGDPDIHLTVPFMWSTRGLKKHGMSSELSISGLLRSFFTEDGCIQFLVISFDPSAVIRQCENFAYTQIVIDAAI